jgi:methionyl aminopeptidase
MSMVTKVKTKHEISNIRESGKMLASVLDVLQQKIQPEMTTKDLDNIAAEELNKLGGQPAFLNYQGFPAVICISVNDEVVHGIPSTSKVIKEGDIVGLDFGVIYNGMITDAAVSVIVGKPKQTGHIRLVQDTERALHEGISVVKDKVRTGDIGNAIEKYVNHRYGIVRDLVGHGVGHDVHEDPNIPNYGRANTGPWLSAGMTIAIEPMLTLGTERVRVADDGWTILTGDGSYSAHFEHTVLITENGAEILTALS